MTDDRQPLATPRLRVGILLGGVVAPRWVRALVEQLRVSAFASLELVVLPEQADTTAGSPWRRWRRAAWTALPPYGWLDRRNRLEPDALAATSVDDVLQGVARVVVDARGTRPRDAGTGALEPVRARRLDVLLRLGFTPASAELCVAARLGVWTCRSAETSPEWDLPGTLEVVRGSAVTCTEVVADGPRPRVLASSVSATDPSSVRRNQNAACWKAVVLFGRALRQAHAAATDGEASPGVADAAGATAVARAGAAAGLTSTARLLARTARRRLANDVRERRWFDQWTILYAMGGDASAAGALPPRLSAFHAMTPPDDRCWADPHVLVRGGRHFVFLEEFLFATRTGHIAVVEFDEEGRPSSPVPVLRRPYHLSNPFLFEHGGELFMIPESAANRTVDLYRCDEFPGRWTHVKVLLRGVRAVDATLFAHGGRWWMFVNIAEQAGTSTHDELFLFHAPDPLAGAWVPHPRNPVVADVRRARPAGPLQVVDGGIVRPAQDCAARYGHAIRFMRVERLDEREYRETEVGYLGPGWDDHYVAVHTFDRAPPLTVVDGCRLRPRRR